MTSYHHVRDHALPPDPNAYRDADPPSGRVIVIAPTRASCETIERALGLHVATLLEQEHGEDIRGLARRRVGFGIVAGTGTGKTLAIRLIAEEVVGGPLRTGVVNREREATPETPNWNVVIVTTGIARRWFQSNLVLPQDTLVVDEIHQTSAELELCLALGKRVGCRFVWLSATVDSSFYRRYLDAEAVLETSAFDPQKAATVQTRRQKPFGFFDHRFLTHVVQERRGVGVFLPTRAEVEELADTFSGRRVGLRTAFYHGGEPIEVIRPYLTGEVDPPFVLVMTAAGQSALNISGLDTVVIYDAQYRNVIDRGRNVLTRSYLGPNEILQMAGRVHGRVVGGEVFILTDRQVDFSTLRPAPPAFQLSGDSERVALSAAAIGVDLTDLDLPVPLDRRAYRRAVALLERRGIVAGGRLTSYGVDVEAMPVERPWGELLVLADDDLVPFVAVAANVESLHRMTRDEHDLRRLVVPGSDHLTAYSIFAEAVKLFGAVGRVYGLPRHLFAEEMGEWAQRRGVLVKALEDIALGVASVYRTLECELPAVMPDADEGVLQRFRDLVARVMPLQFVLDEQDAEGNPVTIARGSVCSNWGGVAGSIRFFADRQGRTRASIEGTNLPLRLIKEYAVRPSRAVEYRSSRGRSGLYAVHRREYFGFELDRRLEAIGDRFPEDLEASCRTALVRALIAGETDHRHQPAVSRILNRAGEYWRRSAGTLPSVAPERLASLLDEKLVEVRSRHDFDQVDPRLELDRLIDADTRHELDRLPSSIPVRGDRAPLDYVIEHGEGVVRLRLREGQARRLRRSDVPALDRPLRFSISRRRGQIAEASSFEELQRVVANLPKESRPPRRGRRPVRPRR